MHGEISKRTCGEDLEKKHFESVGMQMGRVQLDSDWNEAFETTNTSRKRALNDIIGKQGSPNEGFRIDNALLLDRMDSKEKWKYLGGGGEWKIDHFEKIEGTGCFSVHGKAKLTRSMPSLLSNIMKLRQELAAPGSNPLDPKILLYCKASDAAAATIIFELETATEFDHFFKELTISGTNWSEYTIEGFPDLSKFVKISLTVISGGTVYIDKIAVDPGLIKQPGIDFYIQGGDGSVENAGRFYADGIACVKESFETYRTQKDYPEPGTIEFSNQAKLLYLDVWKRTITAVEDPEIREEALGGPDTCTREQIVSQVKLLNADCGANIASMLGRDKSGTLTAKLAAKSEQHICDFNPDLDYTGLDNSLYRVEIHLGGDLNTAKFKWSRNNGADLVPVIKFYQDGSSVLVPGTAPCAFNFCRGDLVELCDDVSDLADAKENAKFGLITKIKDIQNDDPDGIKITLEDSTGIFATRKDLQENPKYHPKLRKWHGVESVKDFVSISGGIPSKEMEHGIRIAFAGQSFFRADYWQFTARINSHSIEELDKAAPIGPKHHYAPLATGMISGGKAVFADCRKTFLPLTAQHAVKVGVDTNFCIERPMGADNNYVRTPENVQQAFDNLCGYIQHLRADNIGVDSNNCISKPNGPGDPNPSVPANVQQALNNLCGYVSHLRARDITFEDGYCKFGVSTVQQVIDQLCRREKGSCGTVTVGDGKHSIGAFTDIQQAIDSLPADIGGKVCIGPGRFDLNAPLHITKKRNVQICGLGNSTLLRIKGHESAIVISECENINISEIKIKTVYPKGAGENKQNFGGRNGSVTFIDSDHISVEGCTLSTPALDNRELACVTVKTTSENGICCDIKIKDNILIPGDRQIGIQVINGKDVVISGNRIHRDRGFTYQGIVCGGRRCENVCIEDNLIRRAFQGIHVGTSHRVIPPSNLHIRLKRLKRQKVPFLSAPAQLDHASQVKIKNNTILISLPDFYERERHGIFVGNCDDLMIRDNSVTVEYASKKSPVDGVRINGYLGPTAVLRDNNIRGIANGSHSIFFSALEPAKVKQQYGAIKWLIIDNMTFCEDPKTDAPKICVDAETKKYVQIIRNC